MQPVGTPTWVDLGTDLDLAKPFYSAVFNWRYTPIVDGAGWLVAHADGAPVAALGPGTPRPWQVLLRSDDVDATVAAVEGLGGKIVLAPGDVGSLGRAAQVQDPGGAAVGLWQAGTHEGFTAMGGHGRPAWFEINTRHRDEVRDFFATLFSLSAQKMEGMDYTTLHADGRPRFGVLQMDEQWAGMDPSWSVYFSVDDADATVACVKQSGGLVLFGPFDTPFGRLAVCKDPLGSVFHAIQSA